jgi:hypothetical protein
MGETHLTTLTHDGRVLAAGEFHRRAHFGPGTVNRGAVLLECEWDGGTFESGMMLGGRFVAGNVRGGSFSGVYFRAGQWHGGTWLGGFDHRGRYRPRGDQPPHEDVTSDANPRAQESYRPSAARRLIIASPHRYPDLARLWHRTVARELAPAFRDVGLDVEIVIFCDSGPEGFLQSRFPGVRLTPPGPTARDFIEFYDAALGYDCDYLFFIDADVFFLDGTWAAGHLGQFADPGVAAVSFLTRPDLPGSAYALLCRRSDYLVLTPPVLACCYERPEDWPDAVHRDPCERAAIRLESLGKRIVLSSASAMDARVADFHGTTNLRVSREMFGRTIGTERFEALVAEHRYFAKAACDNALLGCFSQALFGEPFAPGDDGTPLGGSLTVEATRRALRQFRDAMIRAELQAHLGRSERSVARLAARERIVFTPPLLRPEDWPIGPEELPGPEDE